MKKLVVTPLTNTIWWATVDDKKGMITGNKEDVTDNAIDAVLRHLVNMDGFSKNGFAGYEFEKKNSDGTITIAAYSSNTHVCVSKKLYEELLEYKAMYENLCK